MSHIQQIMEQEADERGILPFARFMELALYCPNFGYYERNDAPPGRRGDFYTSVSTGSLFGELLARQFAVWLKDMPAGKRQVVEAGAHDGRLALDILNWLKRNASGVWEGLEYCILEPSAVRRRSQQTTLVGYADKTRWFESWDKLPATGVIGVIFSNELLDAMPVHRIGWDAQRQTWFGWGVEVRSGRFARMPLADESELAKSIPKLPRELERVLPDGFTTEVALAATDWWRSATGALKHGKLLTFDYGLTDEEFFTPERKEGTLRAYYKHQMSKNVLERPGEHDITAHVNFTALRNVGEAGGLRTEAFEYQSQFLTRILQGFAAESPGEWTTERVRQFQTLTHPEHLGRAFRVLVQARSRSRRGNEVDLV